MMTGIPVVKLAEEENRRSCCAWKRSCSKRVVGQDEAIARGVQAPCAATASGCTIPSGPIGSFIFLGPTGVGKTELARALAEFLFDDEDALIRIDMSEYMEKFSVSRLVGAPPGYVGYEEGGQLTEKVRRKPYSVCCSTRSRRRIRTCSTSSPGAGRRPADRQLRPQGGLQEYVIIMTSNSARGRSSPVRRSVSDRTTNPSSTESA